MTDDRRSLPRADCEQSAHLNLDSPSGGERLAIGVTVVDVCALGAGLVVEDGTSDEQFAAVTPAATGALAIRIGERNREVACKVVWADPRTRQVGIWFSESPDDLAQDPLFHQFVGEEFL